MCVQKNTKLRETQFVTRIRVRKILNEKKKKIQTMAPEETTVFGRFLVFSPQVLTNKFGLRYLFDI
jgi:hypothetical protein